MTCGMRYHLSSIATMLICGLIGCANRPEKSKWDNISFHKTPKSIYNQGKSTRELSEERLLRLWKAALRKQGILTEHI